MPQLVACRAVQGLGAGALIPIALTIIGEIYTVHERARMQAVFSGVWGVASIIGPLVGGWLTDTWSWRLVFYINIPFGIASAMTLLVTYPGGGIVRRSSVDWAGAALLFVSVSALLAALSSIGERPELWVVVAVVLVRRLLSWNAARRIQSSRSRCSAIPSSPGRSRSAFCSASTCSALSPSCRCSCRG